MGNQALAAIVHEIGPGFAARSGETERAGTFVTESYRVLKERKLFSAGVPRELGGGGASYAELAEMLRSLAQYCPSTALALAMHTHCVAAFVWRHLHGMPAAPLLTSVAEAERVLVTTGASDWLASSGSAARVEGGWRVNARKRFASGLPAADVILTSAPAEIAGEPEIVIHFAVRLDTPGVSVGGDWDTLGMRATGSHSLVLTDVFVPDAAVSVKRPRHVWDPAFNVIGPVATPMIIAVYLGLAEHAATLARASAAARQADALLPPVIGELENELMIARLAFDESVRAVRNYDFLPEIDRTNRGFMCKTIAARAVRRCVELAVAASGGAAFYRSNPLERLWRDVQAVQFHPLPEAQQKVFTGRLAMDLPPLAG
jgi:alkylation response protein AidB-like acyl-CoA dehydrogenase